MSDENETASPTANVSPIAVCRLAKRQTEDDCCDACGCRHRMRHGGYASVRIGHAFSVVCRVCFDQLHDAVKALGALILVACLAGCGLSEAYVRADRAVFDVIAEEYLGYVARDQALDNEQAQRRQRLVEAWAVRLREAEKAER
ncbi:MAG TPA: hypothetical protein VIH11_08820 [Gemmatimonadaceae bacterium]